MTNREMTSQEAREDWAALVAAAEHRGETTIITRYGKPVAVVGPIDLLPQENAMPNTQPREPGDCEFCNTTPTPNYDCEDTLGHMACGHCRTCKACGGAVHELRKQTTAW